MTYTIISYLKLLRDPTPISGIMSPHQNHGVVIHVLDVDNINSVILETYKQRD